jgi:hypothetical protein
MKCISQAAHLPVARASRRGATGACHQRHDRHQGRSLSRRRAPTPIPHMSTAAMHEREACEKLSGGLRAGRSVDAAAALGRFGPRHAQRTTVQQ